MAATASTGVSVLTSCTVPMLKRLKLSVTQVPELVALVLSTLRLIMANTAGRFLSCTVKSLAENWSVKAGHFYTLVGYEVVTAPDNFFYSHALTMFNSEPFTHTGVLTTYSGFEGITLYNGWTLGWDTGFDNTNSGNNYLGGIGVDLTDNVSLTYITTYGNFGARDGGQDDSYSHSVVIDVNLTDNLNYVFQSDLVGIDPIDDNGNAVGSNDQIGINQYLFYSLNDIVSLGGRMEWWKSDGTSYYSATSGVNVKLLDNLVFRPEYRETWAPGADIDEDVVGMDMILTY